ncbi:enoyl-CoA hydratase/isomerase family protein [Demequina sp. NBRC 110056]|uniref:enoyl-CoA hydratase/isomerase family protein n=1 Tax=Demequina sp. NBRC 110056 TaxID=1570345 RepID=UPI000A04F8CE|nr:enoyl-CoA hydratase-related protein [Demequina sp. NBRC 110056]
MTAPLRYEVEDGIAQLTFARPARLNAFDFAMGEAYRTACLAAVADPDVSAVLISAEGPAFCAGGDIVAMSTAGVSGSEVTASAHVIHEGIAALHGSSIPVVAAARGAVAGGGIGVLLAADLVVAGPDLRVAGRYADVGLTPDLGVSTLLTRAVGETRALQLLLTRRELDATAALDWGFVAEVTDDPEARALEIARAWRDGATAAFGHAKQLVRASSTRPFERSLAEEAESIGRAYDTDDAQARIAAFSARRSGRAEA